MDARSDPLSEVLTGRGDTGHLPSETRRKYIPVVSDKTSMFCTVPEGRYPISPLGLEF